MNWDKIQQLIRVAMYTLGSTDAASGLVSGEWGLYTGGAMWAAAIVWWLVWEKKRGGEVPVVETAGA